MNVTYASGKDVGGQNIQGMRAVSRDPSLEDSKDHLLASFCGDAAGPTLLAVGSIHGNEPGGSIALKNVVTMLSPIESRLRGRVYLIEGNVRALSQGMRFIDSDLNRHWTQANLTAADSTKQPRSSEDLELLELFSIFTEILSTARQEVFALDLHSTSAAGLPFATVGDTLRNRTFAMKFPVTILLGIEEQLEGTMLEYLNNRGVVTLGFEGGQHDDPDTAVNHEALVWLAMVHTGIVDPKDVPGFERQRSVLAKASGQARIVEVLYRKPVTPEDEFSMDPGYNNFDRVDHGQPLARDRNGIIRSPRKGLLLMPLYQAKGEDGFFIGRDVARFWIWLSRILRHTGMPVLIRVLPGVWRHPDDSASLIVDTKVARFFPLQIFHLLGYRRQEWKGNRLVVSRRKFDTRSPFV